MPALCTAHRRLGHDSEARSLFWNDWLIADLDCFGPWFFWGLGGQKVQFGAERHMKLVRLQMVQICFCAVSNESMRFDYIIWYPRDLKQKISFERPSTSATVSAFGFALQQRSWSKAFNRASYTVCAIASLQSKSWYWNYQNSNLCGRKKNASRISTKNKIAQSLWMPQALSVWFTELFFWLLGGKQMASKLAF